MTSNRDQKNVENAGPLTSPLSARGIPAWATYLLSAIGLIYLLNPTAGILELIPDNLPLIGNLDEGVAALLIWYGLVEVLEGKKLRKGGE